jgi:hypothetical protein
MKTYLALIIVALVAGVAQAQVIDATKIKNSQVKYAPPDKFKEYPPPVLTFINFEREHVKYQDEITERIIYPFLSKYPLPVASLIVDFCPLVIITGADDKKACEGVLKKKVMIDIEVKLQGGMAFTSGFELKGDGHYGKDAYKQMLVDPSYKRGAK